MASSPAKPVFSSLPTAPARGMTLAEVMITIAVLGLGVVGAGNVVSYSTRLGRHSLSTAQAQFLANRELERIVAIGCGNAQSCANLLALDRTSYSIYWTPSGTPSTSAPSGSNWQEYHVAVDVDSASSVEGGEKGEPELGRSLAGAGAGHQANVRVSVGWEEGKRRYVEVLQTRVAP